MPRVLRQVDLSGSARAIAPSGVLGDPAIRAIVDQESARAYERGVQDGIARGRADAGQAAQLLVAALDRALQQAGAASALVMDHVAGGINQLAVEVAKVVVAELEPDDAGILGRVGAALRAIDDRPLVVEVSAADLDVVSAAAPVEVTVEVAADLTPGEARVRGRWADADLTWAAVWSSVQEALDVR